MIDQRLKSGTVPAPVQHLSSSDFSSASTGFSMCIVFLSFSSLKIAVIADLETRELAAQEEYCIESTAGAAEPDSGSHDENLNLGGEGGEEEEAEERTHEHDGRTFEEALHYSRLY